MKKGRQKMTARRRKRQRPNLLLLLAIAVVALVILWLVFTYGLNEEPSVAPSSTEPVSQPAAVSSGRWEVYFTDNLNATETSSAPTELEQALVQRIRSAQQTIDAAFYDFNRASIRDELIAAHQRGVAVRIVTDDEVRYYNDTYIPYYAALEEAGIPLRDDEREQTIMHNKYYIFDGQSVWTGSTNMSDNDMTLNHNNALVLDSPELAALYQSDFDQMWDGVFSVHKTESAVTEAEYQGAPVEVRYAPEDDPLGALVEAINGAQESIDFAIFFLTDDEVRDALLAAHRRGVRVRGLWDRLGGDSPYSADEALCEAGVAIKIVDTRGKMHNKFMVIDAPGPDGDSGASSNGLASHVATGSINWTGSGNDGNDENLLLIDDAELAQIYATAFAAMWDALDPPNQCNVGATSPRPTATPVSSGTASVDIQIMLVVYNPEGDDAEGEYVVIQNLSGEAQNLTGWGLADDSSTTYTFPNLELAPGATLKIWTKAGTDRGSDLFWGRSSGVWNNDGDSALLLDETGAPLDLCSYEGGGSQIECQ
jgi:phosphatidylserine/phosphatidylglycerophosphate/cardiolipin synthase-like enzyme